MADPERRADAGIPIKPLYAAADLTDDDRLGRPRAEAGVGRRLEMLADIVTSTHVPAPVLAAVVHGELLVLQPFGVADGVVARGVSRLATTVRSDFFLFSSSEMPP